LSASGQFVADGHAPRRRLLQQFLVLGAGDHDAAGRIAADDRRGRSTKKLASAMRRGSSACSTM